MVDALVGQTFHGFDTPLAAAQHASDLGANFAFPRDPESVTEGGPVNRGDPKSRSITAVTGPGTSVVYEVQQQTDGSWMAFRASRTCSPATVTTSAPAETPRPAVPCVPGSTDAPQKTGPGFPSPVDAVKGWWDAGHAMAPGSYLDPQPVPGHPHEQIVKVRGSAEGVTGTYDVRQSGDGTWHVVHATLLLCHAG